MSHGRVHLRSFGFFSLLAICLFIASGCADPDRRVEQKVAQAQQKLDSGEFDEGIRLLEELRKEHPERPRLTGVLASAYTELAFLHSGNGDHSQAAEAFSKAANLSPERSELLLYASQAREEAGNLAGAADDYRVYLTGNFEDFSAWQALARLEKERGRYQEAIDAYLNVYRIRPSAQIAGDIGDLFLRLRNLAQAHHWFTTSRRHESGVPAKALIGLLRISMEEENWERAQNLVQELDRVHPEALDASEMAETRNELRRWREAIEEMERLRLAQAERAAQRQAERERLEDEERLAREQAAAEAEQARLARRETEEETELEEDEPEILESDPGLTLLAEADALFAAGRYGSAARLYWRALSYDDSSADTWFNLSRAHFRAEAWNDAELTALEALRRDPQRQNLHLHYLNVIKEIHPVRVYLRELERIHQLFPNNHEVVLALANTYARSQHAHQEAVRYYHMFLRLAPDDPRRPEIEQSIRSLNQP